jgi:hypothetical protein
MILEIGEMGVELLMKGLFGIAAKSVMRLRHLRLEKDGRPTLTTSNPEITLKGVRDEGILPVFGPEIYIEQLGTSEMCKTELQEKQNSVAEYLPSECVKERTNYLILEQLRLVTVFSPYSPLFNFQFLKSSSSFP